jgi:hypothetical protein
MFRELIQNRTNSSFDFLPLIYSTYVLLNKINETISIFLFYFRVRLPDGNYYILTADLSYPGNISETNIENIITPILTNLPPQFNATFYNQIPITYQPLNRKKL